MSILVRNTSRSPHVRAVRRLDTAPAKACSRPRAAAISPDRSKRLQHGRSCAANLAETSLPTLIGRVINGESQALSMLYQVTVRRVQATAYAYLRSAEDAREIVSDVYLYVWRHADMYDRQRGSVRAWLNIVTRNRAIDLFRRRQFPSSMKLGRHSCLGELLVGESIAPDASLVQQQSHLALDDAMRSLAPLRRRVVELSFLSGLSHQGIADEMSMPLGSVKSHIRRGLASLRLELRVAP